MIKLLIISLPLDSSFNAVNTSCNILDPQQIYGNNNNEIQSYTNNNSENIIFKAMSFLLFVMFFLGVLDMYIHNKKRKLKIEEPILNIEEPILKIEEPILNIEDPIRNEFNKNFEKFKTELKVFDRYKPDYHNGRDYLNDPNCKINTNNLIKIRDIIKNFLHTITPENIEFIREILHNDHFDITINNERYNIETSHNISTIYNLNKDFIFIDNLDNKVHQLFSFNLDDDFTYEDFENQRFSLLRYMNESIEIEKTQSPVIDELQNKINQLHTSILSIEPIETVSDKTTKYGEFSIKKTPENLEYIKNIINTFVNSLNEKDILLFSRINGSFEISINNEKNQITISYNTTLWPYFGLRIKNDSNKEKFFGLAYHRFPDSFNKFQNKLSEIDKIFEENN